MLAYSAPRRRKRRNVRTSDLAGPSVGGVPRSGFGQDRRNQAHPRVLRIRLAARRHRSSSKTNRSARSSRSSPAGFRRPARGPRSDVGSVVGWSHLTQPSLGRPDSRAVTLTRNGGAKSAARALLAMGATMTVEERRRRSVWITTAGCGPRITCPPESRKSTKWMSPRRGPVAALSWPIPTTRPPTTASMSTGRRRPPSAGSPRSGRRSPRRAGPGPTSK